MQLLHVREIVALDPAGNNVIRGRPCSSPQGFRPGPPSQGCDRAVDSNIEYDGLLETVDLMHLNVAAPFAWVEWDL